MHTGYDFTSPKDQRSAGGSAGPVHSLLGSIEAGEGRIRDAFCLHTRKQENPLALNYLCQTPDETNRSGAAPFDALQRWDAAEPQGGLLSWRGKTWTSGCSAGDAAWGHLQLPKGQPHASARLGPQQEAFPVRLVLSENQ